MEGKKRKIGRMEKRKDGREKNGRMEETKQEGWKK